MYKLRDYQEIGVKKTLVFIKDKKNIKKPVLVYPTGAGKSLIIAGIANEISEPLLVIQPNKELLIQNYNKYTSYGNEASIFSASLNTKEVGHVTFATPLSVATKANLFKHVKVIIIDECHLQSNPTGILGKFLKQFKNCKIIGLTASPVILLQSMMLGPHLKLLTRTRKSLWNDFLHITQIKEICEKYWCKLKYENLKLDEKDLKWNSSKSEFTEESLTDYYENNNLEEKIINRVKEKDLKDKRAVLIFVPSIADANNLKNQIPKSVVITSMTDKKDRDRLVKDFLSGKIKVMINVLIFSVGFDYPELDCIIDATPTGSVVRWYQKWGRGCRIDPINPKKECLIIDFAGSKRRFGELEDLTFAEDRVFGWAMFSDKTLLTGIPISEIGSVKKSADVKDNNNNIVMTFGKHQGKAVNLVPKDYLRWVIENVTFDKKNIILKEAILKELN